MISTDSLDGLAILVVDDESDVLDTVEDVLDMCRITKAGDFDTARQYLMNYSYDIVVLDIMGVNGFDLLKIAVKRGFPTVMLTAYALTPEALERAIRLGAVSFLPKEKMADLAEFIADVVLKAGQPVWSVLFQKLEGLFKRRFGADWKQRNRFFDEFEQSFEKDADPGTRRKRSGSDV